MKNLKTFKLQRTPYEAPEVSETIVSVESNFLASKFSVSTQKYDIDDETDDWE